MRGALAKAISILVEQEAETSTRFQDLAISLRLCEVDPATKRWRPETDEILIEVGGLWDRRLKRWAGEARKVRVVRVHKGQEDPARYLASWFQRRAQGSRGPQWDDFRRVWSLMFVGGRRGGKTHLACVALAMFVTMVPGCRVWAVSPTQEETDELEQAVRSLVPRRWYRYRGGGAGKPVQFRFPHGGRLFCLSGNKPRALKRGRVDLCLYNEAQNMHKAGWIQVRGAIADNGGLVILACNPPDAEIGRWIEEVYEEARAGKNSVEPFFIDPSANPFIEHKALRDMEADINDEMVYRREVLGEFVPIGTIVFHAWSDVATVRDPPAHFVDVTQAFTQKHLGRPYAYIVGMDFQKTPHMAAVVGKVFIDPAEPDEPLFWLVDEAIVEDADENDLLDALESLPRWKHNEPRDPDDCYTPAPRTDDEKWNPVHCAVVMDASAWFQDGAHAKARTSEKWLRARGWIHLFYPQPPLPDGTPVRKNPDIVERCKAGNARLKAANGRRRMFSCRHLLHVNRSMRSWEIRNLVPYRQSPFAHVCDAVTYPVFRFWGRPPRTTKPTPPSRPIKPTPTERRRGYDGIV